MDRARPACSNSAKQGYALIGIHKQCRSMSRIQNGQRMVAECQYGISTRKYPLMAQMHAVKKTDGKFHAIASGCHNSFQIKNPLFMPQLYHGFAKVYKSAA